MFTGITHLNTVDKEKFKEAWRKAINWYTYSAPDGTETKVALKDAAYALKNLNRDLKFAINAGDVKQANLIQEGIKDILENEVYPIRVKVLTAWDKAGRPARFKKFF